MSAYATLDRAPTLTPTPTSALTTEAAPPAAEAPSNSALQAAVPGVSDAQRALDQAAAAEAGMTESHVSTLTSFGLRPSELDPAAGARMVTALDRAEAHLADPAAGDLVIDDPEFSLRITVTPSAKTGLPERRLLFTDADGSAVSGIAPIAAPAAGADASLGEQPLLAEDNPEAETSAWDTLGELASDAAGLAELLAWTTAGAGAQLMSDSLLGLPDGLLDQVDVESFQDGRGLGDMLSVVVGGLEMMAGAAVIGASTSVTTPAAALVALASGGTLALPAGGLAVSVDALAMALGGSLLLHGGLMMATASKGLQEGRPGDWRYHKSPDSLDAFPGAKRVSPKSRNQGGKMRARWEDADGTIYEWDSQHGTVEKYNRRGKHLGEYDPKTGQQTKPADSKRRTET